MSFRKKLQLLTENTQITSIKEVCKQLLNTIGIPEYQLKHIAFTKLNEMEQKDNFSVEFLDRLKNDLSADNLGIKESLSEVVELLDIKNPQLKYRFKAYESHLNSNVPEHTIAESYLSAIEGYRFNERIKEIYENINSKIKDNPIFELKNVMWEISSSPNKFLFKPLLDKIQEYVENPFNSLKNEIIFEMERINLPQFKNALKVLKTTDNNSALQIYENDKSTSINNVVCPVLISENGEKIFSTRNNYYKLFEGVISKVDITEINEEFKSLTEAFYSFNFNGDKISKVLNGNKVSFSIDEKKFYLNETESTLDNINKLGYFTFGNMPVLNAFMKISENADTIFDIDFAKSINSNNIEASVDLFKFENSIFINKVNHKMKINELNSFTPVTAVNEVKSFLGIDISESFNGAVETDNLKLANITNEQKEIKDSIASLKESLIVLDNSVEKNPTLLETVTLLQEEINAEIEAHQDEWDLLEQNKQTILNPNVESVNEGKKSKKDYENYLDEFAPPIDSEEWIIGGKLRKTEMYAMKYGAAMKKYDPIQFEVGYNEYINNTNESVNEGMSLDKQKEALQNALLSYKIPSKYIIVPADGRLGKKFAIGYESTSGGLNISTNYMTYDEMNKWFLGYRTGLDGGLKENINYSFEDYINETKEEYQKFFNSKLEKYGVKSPSELNDDKKKEFFDEIEKEWKGDSTNENINEGFKPGDKVKSKTGETGEVTAVNDNDETVDILKDDGKTTTFSYDQVTSLEKEIEKEKDDNEGKEDDAEIDNEGNEIKDKE